MVDGVIILTSTEEGLERQRYLEVYKLRNTAHLKGRHNMVIGAGGISVFPRYAERSAAGCAPAALEVATRLRSGIPGLDELLGGGLLKRSVTLVSGSAGVGKSTFGLQFVLEGARKRRAGPLRHARGGPGAAPRQRRCARAAAAGGGRQGARRDPVRLPGAHPGGPVPDRPGGPAQGAEGVPGRARRRDADADGADAARRVPPRALRSWWSASRPSASRACSRSRPASLSSTERVTDQGLSAIADNLLMLRYAGGARCG